MPENNDEVVYEPISYTYEYYGNNCSGRIRVGQKITAEMMKDKDGLIEMENFIQKKIVTPVENPKKGEAVVSETTEEKWLPGFLRIGNIHVIYRIDV